MYNKNEPENEIRKELKAMGDDIKNIISIFKEFESSIRPMAKQYNKHEPGDEIEEELRALEIGANINDIIPIFNDAINDIISKDIRDKYDQQTVIIALARAAATSCLLILSTMPSSGFPDESIDTFRNLFIDQIKNVLFNNQEFLDSQR